MPAKYPPLYRVAEAEGSFGYNVATGEYGDMTTTGVIDPVKVTRLGLPNAASIAGLILTTDCVAAEETPRLEMELAEV
jgi:chaperonin GroEL